MRRPALYGTLFALTGLLTGFCFTTTSHGATPDWVVHLVSSSPVAKFDLAGGNTSAKVVVHEQADRNEPNERLIAVWISVPTRSVEMVVGGRPVKRSIFPEYENSDDPQDFAVTSGSYFEDYNSCAPEGLVISGGGKLHDAVTKKFGGFLISRGPGSLSIQSIHDRLPSGLRNAVQGTPILVREGTVDHISEKGDGANRLAIGIRRNGDIIIAGAFAHGQKGMTLFEFASLLAVPDAQAGPGAFEALNLDGFGQAHIYLPSAPNEWRHFGQSGLFCIPDMLHFRSQPSGPAPR